MDLENQKRVKEFAEKYGPENVVVLLGAAEGEAAGLERGRNEGRAAAIMDLARSMKVKGLDAAAIAEITGLSVVEVEKL